MGTPAGRLLSAPSTAGLTSDADCEVTEQHSQAKCSLGTSFGCFAGNQSMWTWKGCRGKFRCNGIEGVECDVMGGDFAVCPCHAPKPQSAAVYARNLSDGSIAVALYQEADVAGPGAFDFTLLGLPKGTTATVRDLWAHKDLGDFTDSFSTKSVEAHGTVVLRVTPKKEVALVV